MAGKVSSGILVYRVKSGGLEIFLVHPGGPFFSKKESGSWSIPKGEVEPDEEPFPRAIKELFEETGLLVNGKFINLGSIKQKGGKEVIAWAVEYNNDFVFDNSRSSFEIEWPPRTGKKQKFPEVDRGEFFSPDTARIKINPAQTELIDRLETYLKNGNNE